MENTSAQQIALLESINRILLAYVKLSLPEEKLKKFEEEYNTINITLNLGGE